MRIAWAIPCGWARSPAPGRLDLFDCQKDTLLVASLATEVEFDVVIRVVGAEPDFAEVHWLQVVLSDPQMVPLMSLDLPVPVLVPGPHRLPGYELGTNVGTRIAFQPAAEGGYDLSFALDGETMHLHRSTIAVKLLDSN